MSFAISATARRGLVKAQWNFCTGFTARTGKLRILVCACLSGKAMDSPSDMQGLSDKQSKGSRNLKSAIGSPRNIGGKGMQKKQQTASVITAPITLPKNASFPSSSLGISLRKK